MPPVEAAREADVAALRRRVRLLEAELAQQAALVDARSRFLTRMTHELRTPLNGVVGMSQLLTGTPLNAEQAEIVETLSASAENVLTAINDVLDFSKIEAGGLRLESTRFELWGLVESAFEMVSRAAAEKDLRLAYLPADDLPDFFEGDPSRMRQILLNLISNAVKFTHEGEVVVYAEAAYGADLPGRCRLTLRVSDTGVGIREARQSALFNPYDPAHERARQRGSMGLGLAIVQRLAALMQGSLSLVSAPDAGSTFIFTTPLAVSFPARTTMPQSMNGKSVLVADAHVPTLQMMTALLTRTGATVLSATTVDEALRVLDATGVDAAFYSATLSDRSGTRLLVRARQHAYGAHLPALEFHPLGQRPSGTTVITLTTPVQREALYQATSELLRAAPAPADDAGSATHAAQTRTNLRILLAEDNPINQMVALRLLDSLGYRADVVENGLEAVEAVQRRAYDIVLMDIMMPVMDGLEATRRIRQAKLASPPRIIAVTANALASDRQRCLEAGMDEHLAKPLRAEVLAQALRRFGSAAIPEDAAAPTAAPTPAGDGALNYDTLRELRASLGEDDTEFFRGLVEDFLTDAADLLAQLREATDAGDAPTARRAVHTLKSSAAMFGAGALSDLARRAELAAKDDDLDTVRQLIAPTQQRFDEARTALEALERSDFAAL